MKRKLIYVSIFLLFVCHFGAMAAQKWWQTSKENDISKITSYIDVPGITQEEIIAIERIKSERGFFTYGSFYSTESFTLANGNPAGFSARYTDFLSEFFGIRFVLQLSEWDILKTNFDAKIIDFNGDLTPTPERLLTYSMTSPIVERSLGLFTYSDYVDIRSETDLEGKRLGFLAGTITASSIIEAYPDINFEVIDIQNSVDAIESLRTRQIDAYVIDAVAAYTWMYEPLLNAQDFFPLIYTPASLATANNDLEPFISVMNKYIDSGGIRRIQDFYRSGNEDYAKHRFSRFLNEEEAVYLANLYSNDTKIKIAVENDRYPISFYDPHLDEFQGIAIDILSEISILTGIVFDVTTDKNTTWTTILNALRNHEVQMVTTLTHTRERERYFSWTDTPYFRSNYALLSKSDMPNTLMSRVIDSKVGVIRGTVSEEIFEMRFPGHENITRYNNYYTAFDALEKGDIELFMTSQSMLLFQINFREKSGYKANIIFPSPIEESFFGFPHDEILLRSIISKAQNLVATEDISTYWNRKVYDYSKQRSEARTLMLSTLLVLLLIVFIFIIILYIQAKRKRKQTEAQTTVLKIINTLSNILLETDIDKLENSLFHALELLATTVDVDRVFIWRNSESEEGLRCSRLYEWSKRLNKLQRNKKPYYRLYNDGFSELYESLSNGRCINSKMSDRPLTEQTLLARKNIYSMLISPIFYQDVFWGFIGFDDCERERIFTDADEMLLRSAGGLITSALLRLGGIINKAIEAEHRLQSVYDNTPLAISYWNNDLEIVDCNEETLKTFGFKTKKEFIEGFAKLQPEHQPDGTLSSIVMHTAMKKAFEDGYNWLEYTHRTSCGKKIPLDITMARIQQSNDDYGLMIYCRDVSVHKAIMDAERKKEIVEERNRAQADYLKKLSIVNDLSIKLFLSEIETFDNDLWQSMRILGKAVDADRMFIWKNYTKDGILHCFQLFEWAEGAEATMNDELSQGTSYKDTIPEWESLFLERKIINDYVCNLSDNEKQILEPQGILSILIIPMFLNDYFWGFVGFDDCHQQRIFSDNDEKLLRTVSMLLINAITRNDMAKDIKLTNSKLEDALQKAENDVAAKTKFLATMSHEIRTPMNAIIGIAQIELQKAYLPDAYTSSLERIYSSGSSLMGIINDILDMSKIETGKMEIKAVDYDIPSLINDTVQLNIVRIGSKQIEFILDVDPDLPMRLIGDELRIKQILNNLLSNAIKYTEKGYVKFTVSLYTPQKTVKRTETDQISSTSKNAEKNSAVLRKGGSGDVYLKFSVTDTGQGMRPKDKKRIFSEYLRFNVDSNWATEGTGIGLTIVKNIVDLMDGKIEVESKYGHGSTFTVVIKQQAVKCKNIGKQLVHQLKTFTFSGERQSSQMQIIREPMPYGKVLIVDDVETNLYVAQGLMSFYGLQIDTAISGLETIEKIEEGKIYDIIFMDHMMPVMDGIETTQKLRSMGYKNAIIALTANAISGSAEMFRKFKFDGFIPKPIDVRVLDAYLRKYVKSKHPQEASKFKDLKKETADVQQVVINQKLLDVFKTDAEKALVALRNNANEDIKLFTSTAHSIKSALAYIGEADKAAVALSLERAGANGDLEFIAKNTEGFINSIESLLKKLFPNDIIANNSNIINNQSENDNYNYLKEQLIIIKTACQEYNYTKAYNQIDELAKNNWNKQVTTMLFEIMDMLFFNSEFEKAVEIIDDFLNQ